jgi:subfamily B ATP-binding cassette protein HlyB/CyaB
VTDQLLIPITGGLLLTDPEGRRVGRLERRRALSLRAFLEGRPHEYRAAADGPVTALALPRARVVALLSRHPEVVHYLRLVTRVAGLRSFRTFLEEHGVPRGQVVEVLRHASTTPVDVQAGQQLDLTRPGLWFVRHGHLSVRRAGAEAPLRLGEGAWLGGQSLVPPHAVEYAVQAVAPSQLYWASGPEIAPLLRQLDVLDAVYEDPWLRPAAPAEAARRGRLSPLPGKVEDRALLSQLGLHVDPRRLVQAEDDAGSLVASVCNVASFLHVAVNPARVEAGLALADQVTPLRLADELEAFGLMADAVQVAPGALPSPAQLPALARIGARLVVLLAVHDGALWAWDAPQGLLRIPAAELQGAWDGHLLAVERAAEATPEAQPGGTARQRQLGRVLRLFARQGGLLWNLTGLMAIGFGLQLVGPLFFRYILDDVLLLDDFSLVTGLVAGLALVTAFSAAVTFLQHHLTNELSVRFDRDLSARFYRHALSLPPRFFAKGRVGDIIARLYELRKIREFFSSSTVSALIGLGSILAYAGILFVFSLPIALVGLGVVALLITVQVAGRAGLRRLHRQVFEADKKATSLLAETFAAITTVKASGAEDVLRGRWEQAFLDGVQARRRLELRTTAIQSSINLISGLGTSGVIWFACVAALEGQMSVGSILAVSMYLQAMLRPTASLSSLLSLFEETNVAFSKLEEVLDAEPEESPDEARVTHTTQLRGKVRLERVSFGYGEGPRVLDDVSLTIYPNQTVAVVGRSGSGKTTLANLIAGNLAPTEGRIFYDHYDATMLSKACLRRQVGFVQQNFSLFGGSLASNVAFTDDAPDPARIEASAGLAHVKEFVERMPARYEYVLAPRGVGLSGGQRQRVAIARTLYRDSSILIMDEALSALDADSEAAINENMTAIAKGRTTIVIAHRLSTVRRADRIIVVEDGRVVEDGDHRTLIRRGGPYAELFEGQLSPDDTLEERA